MPKNPPHVATKTVLRCIECGLEADLLRERLFRCQACGGLLEVHHDFASTARDELAKFQRAKSLKRLFDERSTPQLGGKSQTRSGVWRFHELIMPMLPEEQIVSLGEGLFPIVPAGSHLREWVGADLDLWLILEGQNPTGSFKDCGGTVMMSIAKAAGVPAVGCASTGDTSAMAAAYAAAAGITCFVLLPEGKVTPVQLMQPAAHGARVITIPGSFDDCMRVMQELVAHHGAYPANSLNPARIEGHQATVFLVAQALNWQLPDWFALPVGNGSNTSSVGKGLRLLGELGFSTNKCRILAAQAEAANPLASSWKTAQAEGGDLLTAWRRTFKSVKVGETTATAARIGDPVSREKVMREIVSSNGTMQTASEEDLNEAMFVCAKDGYLSCPQTGIALAGLRNAVARGIVREGERVVVVSTATGLKFSGAYEPRIEPTIERSLNTKTDTVARMLKLS